MAEDPYFVSNRRGALGGADDVDIYRAIQSKYVKWGRPERLPAPINSVHREELPFALPGSNVHNLARDNDGDLDFYQTSFDDGGEWTTPENLGPGFNSRRDDLFICVQPDERTFYISSERKHPASQGMIDNFIVRRVDTAKPVRRSPNARLLSIDPKPANSKIAVAALDALPLNTTLQVHSTSGDKLIEHAADSTTAAVMDVVSLPNGYYPVNSAIGHGWFVGRL